MGDVSRLRIPPHSVEAEQALLGAVLIEPAAWSRAAVKASDFFRADHRVIFEAAAKVVAKRQPTDGVTVMTQLHADGQLEAAGGADYIAQLIEQTSSAANIAAYAQIIREKSSLRRLQQVASDAVAGVFESGRTAEQQVGDAMQALLGLAESSRTGRGLVGVSDLVSALMDDLDRRLAGERGLSVGLSDFDAISNGLEPGDLVVIAGRPGMGKTALLVSIASHVSRDAGVAIFSAEMSSQQLLRRCVSLVGSVEQGKLRKADELQDAEWESIGQAAELLAARRLWIDDTPSPSLNHVRSQVLALKSRAPLGLVMIDYVQLIQGTGNNRYEQLRDVAYGLKALAKEAGAPVILLAQLNRGVESRDHKRGRLSDLRDSGAIEEAADIVGMLYSEGYYNPDFGMPYVLECAIEKNRNGERGECLWHFAGAFSRVGVLQAGAREHYRTQRAQMRKPVGDDL
jgi:replicative DNA helicase